MNWRRISAGVMWANGRRRWINGWIVRAASFYFGYRILHHEVFDIGNPDGLLIMLGLWLCGIAPTTFFDQLRKAGVETDMPSVPGGESGTQELESTDAKRQDQEH